MARANELSGTLLSLARISQLDSRVAHEGAISAPFTAFHALQGSNKCLIKQVSLKIAPPAAEDFTSTRNMLDEESLASTAEPCLWLTDQARRAAPTIGARP